MKPPSFLRKTGTAAFSLVEVTLALGIAAFTLLAVFGLMPIGMNANRTSTEQTMAADIATQIVADLRAARVTDTQSSRFEVVFPTGTTPAVKTLYFSDLGDRGNLGEDQKPFSTTLEVDSRYRVEVRLRRLDNSNKMATVGVVSIFWPAASTKDSTLGVFRVPVALDRNF